MFLAHDTVADAEPELELDRGRVDVKGLGLIPNLEYPDSGVTYDVVLYARAVMKRMKAQRDAAHASVDKASAELNRRMGLMLRADMLYADSVEEYKKAMARRPDSERNRHELAMSREDADKKAAAEGMMRCPMCGNMVEQAPRCCLCNAAMFDPRTDRHSGGATTA